MNYAEAFRYQVEIDPEHKHDWLVVVIDEEADRFIAGFLWDKSQFDIVNKVTTFAKLKGQQSLHLIYRHPFTEDTFDETLREVERAEGRKLEGIDFLTINDELFLLEGSDDS